LKPVTIRCNSSSSPPTRFPRTYQWAWSSSPRWEKPPGWLCRRRLLWGWRTTRFRQRCGWNRPAGKEKHKGRGWV